MTVKRLTCVVDAITVNYYGNMMTGVTVMISVDLQPGGVMTIFERL